MISFEEIRETFGVPAKPGMRCGFVWWASFVEPHEIPIFALIEQATLEGDVPVLGVRCVQTGIKFMKRPDTIVYYDDTGEIIWQPKNEAENPND